MNLRSIIFCLLIMSYALSSAQQNSFATPTLPPTTINITLNTANRADLNQVNDLNQQANHQAIQKTDVATKVDSNFDLHKKLYRFLEEQSKNASIASDDILAWIQNNKIKTGCATLVVVYGCIAAQIYRANATLNDPDSWSNWHHGATLEDLFATPQHQLESDLLFAIQTKYVHPVNPTDFIYSIVQSSQSLKEEIKIVQDQIWRYELIEQCSCLPLFFIQAQDVQDIKNRHRKLLFMQHLFASWCAHYKIEKNN